MAATLATLGVAPGTLTDQQRHHLDDQGFLVLPAVIDDLWLQSLRDRIEALYAEEGSRGGAEVHTEAGTRRLADLVNKGDEFDGVWSHPLVLAAVNHSLGRPFKLSSLNGRDALPGHGLQALHCDWSEGYHGTFHVCNSIWLLDDMDHENGGTRLVPGTHRSGTPAELLDDPKAPHPDEIVLEAPAGSVCVFSSHLWHGGTLNRSGDRTRRGLHCYYTAREHRQQTDQQRYLRYETWKRLDGDRKFLLGVTD